MVRLLEGIFVYDINRRKKSGDVTCPPAAPSAPPGAPPPGAPPAKAPPGDHSWQGQLVNKQFKLR